MPRNGRSEVVTSRKIDAIDHETMEHIRAAQKSYEAAKKALLGHYRRAKKARDKNLTDFVISQLAFLYGMAGWTRDAYDLLAEQEKKNPKDLHAKLRIAEFYFRSGGDYQSALNKAKQLRLPKKPRSLDHDACFNALALRGQAELMLSKNKNAIRTMKELSEFTKRHLKKTIFFFDLAFVSQMVQKRLALGYCKEYLSAIDQVEQVVHDQAATKRLLQLVDGLLSR